MGKKSGGGRSVGGSSKIPKNLKNTTVLHDAPGKTTPTVGKSKGGKKGKKNG